jgi:hypothetical protein
MIVVKFCHVLPPSLETAVPTALLAGTFDFRQSWYMFAMWHYISVNQVMEIAQLVGRKSAPLPSWSSASPPFGKRYGGACRPAISH